MIVTSRRFDPALMLHPSRVCLSGAGTALGARIAAHLTASSFQGTLDLTGAMENADLALVADAAADVGAALTAHATRGARGAIVLTEVADLAGLARRAGIRVLGPHAYGIVLPGLGLNGSDFAMVPAAGRVALVGQSATLARCVIDWAVPNAVGFSHIIGIGGNTDMGFGLVLDHLSRDPGTAAIMVEVDRLRDPKLFFTAARAAARLRPVIALAPGVRLRDAAGNARPALEAAFARAGVLLTSTIGGFLAAAETLSRVRPARGEGLAILTNSVAAGRLAADYALESGLSLATLSAETSQVMALLLGRAPAPGPIYAGLAPTRLADLAALLSSAPEVGGILVVHAPAGDDDEIAVAALIACAATVHVPLLIAAMGETSGTAHRHRLAQAGLASFDTPESAIAGFGFLLQNRRNRAAARELPARAVIELTPDRAAAAARLAAARAVGQGTLVQDDALAVIGAYQIPLVASHHATGPAAAARAAAAVGFPAVLKLSHPALPTHGLAGSVRLDLWDAAAVRTAAETMLASLPPEAAAGAGFLLQRQIRGARQLRIRIADHPVLGPVIGFGAGGGDPEDLTGLAADLPPLNLALAHALIRRAPVARSLGAQRGQPAADEDAIAATLVQVSQLVVDLPEILEIDIDPIFALADGVVAASARLTLREDRAVRPPLIISPYPAGMISYHEAKGLRFLLRPIRPEDADAHAALFERFTPEDMRYRFFSALRRLPTEQITRMTDIDYTREMAIVAVDQADGRTAGAARLVRNDTDGMSAEFAVAVEPAVKGLGLASALMRTVIAWGRDNGVRDITGQILADNAPMLAFIKRLGFELTRVPEDPEVVEAVLVL